MSDKKLFEPLTAASSSITEESENNFIETVIPIDITNSFLNNFICRKKTKRKKHDKFEGYNIKRKLLSHYFIFISNLINTINRFFFRGEKNSKKVQFSIIRYNFKKSGLKKDIFKSLKELTIEDLLLNYQNDRNKKKNEEVYKIVIQESVINKILKEKCFDYGLVYKYYKNKKEFNFLKYGFNTNIHLNSITKSFEDLLKSNLSDNEDENEKYQKEMEKCIQKFFFDKYFKEI